MGKEKVTVDPIADQLEWTFGVYYIDDNYPTEQITKLFTTKMAEYVIQKMEDKVNPGKPSILKYAGLSGHESNVIPFMLQYGLTSLDCIIDNLKKKTSGPQPGCETSPKFAANFMWELSQDAKTNKWFVGTFFNNKLIRSCETPNADNYCAYNDFKAFLQKNFILSPKEFDEVCGPDKPQPPGPSGETTNLWVYIGIGLIVLVVIQLVIILFVVSKLKARVVQNIEDSNFQPSLDTRDKYQADKTPLNIEAKLKPQEN